MQVKKMCELDVFAGNFTLIDWDIHALWIDGFTAAEAVTFLKHIKDCIEDPTRILLDA